MIYVVSSLFSSFHSVTLRGSSPGSCGAQKLAAALIEIESLPYVEKVLTVFFTRLGLVVIEYYKSIVCR